MTREALRRRGGVWRGAPLSAGTPRRSPTDGFGRPDLRGSPRGSARAGGPVRVSALSGEIGFNLSEGLALSEG